MFKTLSKTGEKITHKVERANYESLLSSLKPTLVIAALIGTCTAGLAYFFYQKEVEAYDLYKTKKLERLEKKLIKENSEMAEYNSLILELTSRVKKELEGYIDKKKLRGKSLNISQEFERLDERFHINHSKLQKKTILLIFDAFFYLIKDNLHGFGYPKVIEKFREKRRKVIKFLVEDKMKIDKISSKIYKEYAAVCEFETTVVNQIVIKTLDKILKSIGLKKAIFDQSFLILGEEFIEIKDIMRNTFTKLTEALRTDTDSSTKSNSSESSSKPQLDGNLLLEILEFRIKNYPKLSMFNGLKQPNRRFTRLKFMADIIYFKYGLEDEDLFVRDPRSQEEENEINLNPKLKRAAKKIQKALQVYF